MENLNNGFYLLPIESEYNNNKYSYLYKDGIKLSDIIFRKGGICNGFKDRYCSLIQYEKVTDNELERRIKDCILRNKDKKLNLKAIEFTNSFTFGEHVIINEQVEICLKSELALDYPSHIKGIIGRIKNRYYNLKTKTLLVEGDTAILSNNFIFIENRYNKNFDKGVYKIDFYNANIEFFI